MGVAVVLAVIEKTSLLNKALTILELALDGLLAIVLALAVVSAYTNDPNTLQL